MHGEPTKAVNNTPEKSFQFAEFLPDNPLCGGIIHINKVFFNKYRDELHILYCVCRCWCESSRRCGAFIGGSVELFIMFSPLLHSACVIRIMVTGFRLAGTTRRFFFSFTPGDYALQELPLRLFFFSARN